MNVLNTIASLFVARKKSDISKEPVVMGVGCKAESPDLIAKREEAKEKMKQWGRKSLLEGGRYNRDFEVLRPSQMSMF
jgi:hypothetical protein